MIFASRAANRQAGRMRPICDIVSASHIMERLNMKVTFVAVAMLAHVAQCAVWTNPVWRADCADPTFWQAPDGTWRAASTAKSILKSKDFFHWEDTGKRLFTDAEYARISKEWAHVWAPDMFKLGDHRLMCGDATSSEMAAELMGGVKADLIFTDPPYDFDDSLYNHVLDENLEDGHVFIMNDDVNMVRYLKNSSFRFEEFYVADFGFAALMNNRPNLQHILVSHETKGDPYRPDVSGEDFTSIIKMKYRGTLDDDRTSHFHQKSIAFMQLFIEKFAVRRVLDIFGGSGSTLLACENAGKACYMMELEPEFCQLIIDRWEAATGRKAERI